MNSEELVVLDVAGFPLRRRWYAVHRKGKRLTNAAQGFLDFLQQEGGRYRSEVDPTFSETLSSLK